MLITPQGASDVIAYVTRHMVCAHCAQPYGVDDVRVARHQDGEWLLIATCPACQAEQTINAYDEPPYEHLRSGSVLAPARVTQGTVEEWADFLSGFGGDMYDLLASP